MLGSLINSRDSGSENLGRFILLTDSQTDGSFLVHHFINQALKDGHHTLLVSLTQSLLHYSSVASKLGNNLAKKKEEGIFTFIDGMSSLLKNVYTSGITTTTTPPAPPTTPTPSPTSTRTPLHISLGSDYSLWDIYHSLKELVIKGCQAYQDTPPVCLIIDGLSNFLNVGVALSEVVLFVQACSLLLTSRESPCQGRGYLVVMVHREEEGEESEDILYKQLLYLSHLHLSARGLTTGYSKEVHGEVSVSWRDPSCSGEVTPPPQNAQYKLTDRHVQLFAKGMSREVL